MEYGKKSPWYWFTIYLVIGGLVYAGVYYYFLKPKGGYNYNADTTQPSPSVLMTPATNSPTIQISSSGYSPATLTVAVGATVTWTNTGNTMANVSSDPHPQHTTYPPLNLGIIKPGASESLQFDTPGTYTFHNHLNATQTGTIIVK